MERHRSYNMTMERHALEAAFSQFLEERRNAYRPSRDFPLPYERCDRVHEGGWHAPGATIVANDLRELTNLFNAWHNYQMDWAAWLSVCQGYSKDDQWTLLYHLFQTAVFYCMFQPSAMRDRFGTLGTNAIHQANLAVDRTYKDRLPQDETSKAVYGRGFIERQLRGLGARWSRFGGFYAALGELDQRGYREVTRNYRNLASHWIAPHFEEGITNMVARSIVPWTELVEREPGRFELQEHATRRAVSYGFGGTKPLSLKEMLEANRGQLERAVAAYRAYESLLDEILAALAGRTQAPSPA